MSKLIAGILRNESPGMEEIVTLLQAKGNDRDALFRKAAEVKEKYLGNKVYFRGLIEFSNICHKNCYYCGIRKDNNHIERYNLFDNEIISAARFAFENNFGSISLQSGELENSLFTGRISGLLKKIKEISGGKLGITISLGEQAEDVYREWYNAGAHRYLLRIETTNRDLYGKIHPGDNNHSFDRRVECLRSLQKIGYQTGTGVMIGLPFQTIPDLARDLIFMRDLDIDMVGMGPYIEHPDTPLIAHRDSLLTLQERFELSLKMVAVLRILMKDINIAAATALQAIDPFGREKAISTGANIIMPNITPGRYRNSYKLYENKPCTDDAKEDSIYTLESRLVNTGAFPGYGEWGDSPHYYTRQKIDRLNTTDI